MKGKMKKFMASLLVTALCVSSGFEAALASEAVPSTVESASEDQNAETVLEDGGMAESVGDSSESTQQSQDLGESQSEAADDTTGESASDTVASTVAPEDREDMETSDMDSAALNAATNSMTVSEEYNKITVTADDSARHFEIRLQNLKDTSFKKIHMPVWSQKGGQDDIHWYLAKKVSDTEWVYTVDIAGHKGDAGKYELHVYGEAADGSMVLLNGESFDVPGITPGSVTCSSADTAQGLYRIEVTNLSSPAGIKKVEIPVWSEHNGQDDIVWYEAKQSNGIWYIDVDVRRHGYDSGTYNAHVYATDSRGMNVLAGYTRFSVSAMPKNQLQVELNGDQSKATVTLKNANVVKGTEYVSFPVWGTVSGQNDIIWYRANKIDAYTYQVTIPVSNHKECGTYEVHAYSVKGSKTTLLANTKFLVEGISGKIRVSKQDDVNGYFTLEVDSIAAPAKITKMQIPVWSNKNGQDDIQWYTAKKNGDKWSVTVDVGKHRLDTGVYNAHVYVTDSRGISGMIAATTVNVKAPTAAAKVTAKVMPDHATVQLTATNIIGADKVRVPVWGESKGQNDVVWYDMNQVDSRTWQTTVSLGNHMETGAYQAHVYAVTNGSMKLAANTSFHIDKIVVNAISLSNRDDETGNFTVNVQNISGISNVTTVLVGVWSAEDNQDDLTWYTARNVKGKWVADINTQNHRYDRGTYFVHVYAYNANSSMLVGGVTTDVVINGKLGFVREGADIYYYPTLNKKAYGFERIDGARYFFDRTTGAMAVGWKYIDGYKYYFDGYGKMVQDIDALIGVQSSYILKINKQSNCVTMYAYDPATASYCIPVKSMLCSTGDPTPLGTYPLSRTYRWLLMYNGTYCQYLSLITGDYLIHSITYERYGDIYSLQTIGYNRLGVNKSAGCVRLRCGDAYWVYNLVNSGRLRQVTIYNSANPGPFDRPYVAPIPDNQRWDPTDPAI